MNSKDGGVIVMQITIDRGKEVASLTDKVSTTNSYDTAIGNQTLFTNTSGEKITLFTIRSPEILQQMR